MPVEPSTRQRRPALDGTMDRVWWNILKPLVRADWLKKTWHVCSVTDTWTVFKRSQVQLNNRSP